MVNNKPFRYTVYYTVTVYTVFTNINLQDAAPYVIMIDEAAIFHWELAIIVLCWYMALLLVVLFNKFQMNRLVGVVFTDIWYKVSYILNCSSFLVFLTLFAFRAICMILDDLWLRRLALMFFADDAWLDESHHPFQQGFADSFQAGKRVNRQQGMNSLVCHPLALQCNACATTCSEEATQPLNCKTLNPKP